MSAALGVHEDEVFFTTGGTESNNLALFGAIRALDCGTLVTSRIEHSSVLETARAIEASGRSVVYLSTDREALVELSSLDELLAATEAPLLVTIQMANGEVGSLQPVRSIVNKVRLHSPLSIVHTDAVQALGRIPLALEGGLAGVDLASLSAHKVGGPLGVGILYRKRGTPLAPLLHGGRQEGRVRPGTENAAAIAAAALAIELAVAETHAFERRARMQADELWTSLRAAIPDVQLLGPPLDRADLRLANTLCIVIPATDGKVLVTALDLAGLEVSAGSACASGSVEPSHVLRAMGLGDDIARAGLRLSLGWPTSPSDCAHAVETLRKVAGASRASRGPCGAL